jgi:hypothetical protein
MVGVSIYSNSYILARRTIGVNWHGLKSTETNPWLANGRGFDIS